MTAWTQEEDRLILRGWHTSQTTGEMAAAINTTVYHGLLVRTAQNVCDRIRRNPSPPSFTECREMFEEGKSTKTIATELGWFESEIYNILAWGRGTVMP